MKSLFALLALIVIAFALVASPQQVTVHPDDGPALPGTISVVSLNMAKEHDVSKVFRDIEAAPRLRKADVFLLQEVANGEGKPSIADEMARKWGYNVAFTPSAPTVYDQGLAVISRFPISDLRVQKLKSYNLRFHTRHRLAMGVRLSTPSGDVRIWNAHLDTRVTARERLDQIDPVIEDAAKFNGPRLIGGDFNTNDFSWIGHVLPVPHRRSYALAVRREMEAHHFQTPFQDDLITFPLTRQHLDWMFVNKLEPLNSGVENVPFSDHHAIWARMRVDR
jgi:endonuclease/exonuclease/phosphatase family metal-dependent hydrolase